MWKMNELALVSAGIGGGFVDMNELYVMKFKEAMAGKDAKKWQKAVDNVCKKNPSNLDGHVI